MDHNDFFNEEEFLEKVKDAAAEGARKGAGGGFEKGLFRMLLLKMMIPALVVVALMMLVLPRISLGGSIKDLFTVDAPVENHDLTLANKGILGYTVADFQDAVLKDSTKLKELEVLSYKVTDAATLTKTGLMNIKAFTKTQLITYHGTAVYSVDLSKITRDSIKLDEENKKVVIEIPHAQLKPINIQAEEIEFGDVDKGLLAFGDLTMTPDQMKEVQVEAQKKMEAKLIEEKIVDEADRFGKLAVWEIYQPIIAGVSSQYSLEVVFAK